MHADQRLNSEYDSVDNSTHSTLANNEGLIPPAFPLPSKTYGTFTYLESLERKSTFRVYLDTDAKSNTLEPAGNGGLVVKIAARCRRSSSSV